MYYIEYRHLTVEKVDYHAYEIMNKSSGSAWLDRIVIYKWA